MSIDKIEHIRDYRIFRDYLWPDDLDGFSRLNLIYGWNGSGKTTFSSLFQLLQNKIKIAEGDVRFIIDGVAINGCDISPETAPPVRVFNRHTVNASLFEDPHQELAPVFYLGEESAEKQRKVIEIKDQIKEQNERWEELIKKEGDARKTFHNFCSEKASSIKLALTRPGGGPYNNFNRALFQQRSDALLENGVIPGLLTETEIEQLLVTKNGSPLPDIKRLSVPHTDYSSLTRRVKNLLERSVTTSILEELLNDPQLANWIQKGLKLHTGERKTETCHFCEQNIPDGRIQEIEGHFSDELTRFQEELDSAIRHIESQIETINSYRLPDAQRFYPHIQERYRKVAEGWPSSCASVSEFLRSLATALKKKRDRPFDRLDLDKVVYEISSQMGSDAGWFLRILGILLDASQNFIAATGLNKINQINALVDEQQEYTKKFEQEVDAAVERLVINYIAQSLEEFKKLRNAQDEPLVEMKKISGLVEEESSRVASLEREILQHRKAADELNSEMKTYLGRDELKFKASENGYRITRSGAPAYHLSEGERTAISFMYFLKTLEDESFDTVNGVVVIDDPISSLDANSLYSAFSFMKEKTKSVKQLFVLTHNFAFFRLVRRWFYDGMRSSRPDRHTSRLFLLDQDIRDGKRSSKLGTVDPLLKDYESEYHFLFKKVWEESQRQPGTAELESYYGLPNVGRRLLESFLTFKLPNLEASRLERKMDQINFDPSKKTRILRFLHAHSHFDQIGAPEHDLSVLTETPQILSDLMELIKSLDGEHYAGMESLFQPLLAQS